MRASLTQADSDYTSKRLSLSFSISSEQPARGEYVGMIEPDMVTITVFSKVLGLLSELKSLSPISLRAYLALCPAPSSVDWYSQCNEPRIAVDCGQRSVCQQCSRLPGSELVPSAA